MNKNLSQRIILVAVFLCALTGCKFLLAPFVPERTDKITVTPTAYYISETSTVTQQFEDDVVFVSDKTMPENVSITNIDESGPGKTTLTLTRSKISDDGRKGVSADTPLDVLLGIEAGMQLVLTSLKYFLQQQLLYIRTVMHRR